MSGRSRADEVTDAFLMKDWAQSFFFFFKSPEAGGNMSLLTVSAASAEAYCL